MGGEIQKKTPGGHHQQRRREPILEPRAGRASDEQDQRLYPSEAYVEIQGRRRKAMADQIATVSKERLSKRMGRLSASDMSLVEQALRVQLALV
jgi:mRNA interferase MazF